MKHIKPCKGQYWYVREDGTCFICDIIEETRKHIADEISAIYKESMYVSDHNLPQSTHTAYRKALSVITGKNND